MRTWFEQASVCQLTIQPTWGNMMPYTGPYLIPRGYISNFVLDVHFINHDMNVNIHIDINMNVDIHIITTNRRY